MNRILNKIIYWSNGFRLILIIPLILIFLYLFYSVNNNSEFSLSNVFYKFKNYFIKNQIITFNITSEYQDGNTPIHILIPENYDPIKKYYVLYILPVEPGINKKTLKLLIEMDIHNHYDLIVVYPNMAIEPWFGDHASNPKIRQESYMINFLIPFIDEHYSTIRSKEGRLLLGYSKSGWGAFSLIMRNPDFFGYAASWDAPMFSDSLIYKMEDNFGTIEQMKKYEPSSLILIHKENFTDSIRLLLTGEELWGQLKPSPLGISHTIEMFEILKSNDVGIIYDNNIKSEHSWNKVWLGKVIEQLMNLCRNN